MKQSGSINTHHHRLHLIVPYHSGKLIDWLKLLMADDIPEDILKDHDNKNAIPPLYGALLKNEQDVHLLEKLAFMHRAKR